MKRILFLFLILILPFNIYAIDINSKNAILYNLNEDSILYEVKSNEKVYIASMTKIMTALVAIEKIENMDEKVTMTSPMFKNLVEQNASVAGFKEGEIVTYKDLLYGLMLPSGADAAQGLAISTYGSIDNFVSAMNNKVKEFNLKNTHFSNPTGLDDIDNYSTVYDVAQILKVALNNKDFKEVFESNKYTTSNGRHVFIATRNKFDFDTSFIDGSKTGFTYDAGLCMASTSHKDGVNFLLVTANAPYNNRTNHLIDAKKIYEYYFDNYGEISILNKNELLTSITLEDGRVINYYSNSDIKKYLKNSCNITKGYYGLSNLNDYDIKDKIGEYIIKCDDNIIYNRDIVLNIFHINEKNNNSKYIIICTIMFLLLVGGIMYAIFNKRRNKKRIKN